MPIGIADAFLAIYEFAFDNQGVSAAWLGAGSASIKGQAYERLKDSQSAFVRRTFQTGDASSELVSRLEIEDAITSICSTGDVSPVASASLIRALRLMDHCMAGLHPLEGVPVDDMESAVKRGSIRKGEPIFESDRFIVLPRPRRIPPEERGQPSPNDLLSHVCVIERPARCRIVYQVHEISGVPVSGRFTRIGVIPTINSAAELTWSALDPGHYVVGECADHLDGIADRVTRAIDALCERNVELVVLPELVSGTCLHRRIVELLNRRDEGERTIPGLVVAGTYLHDDEGKPRNRAHALDGAGLSGWHQDKLHAYQFTAAEQASSGHPLGPDPIDRFERIRVDPWTLAIVDISASQRVVILTCEDVIQDQPHRQPLVESCATTIVVPIMGGCLRVDETTGEPDLGWLKEGAMRYIRHPSATTVIANSGALVQGPPWRQWDFAHVFSVPVVRANLWVPIQEEGQIPIAWFIEL